MINIKIFDSNLIKIGNKSYKNIDIYYIGYMKIKSISDYENIYSVHPLYLITGKVDGYHRKRQRSIDKVHKTLGRN